MRNGRSLYDTHVISGLLLSLEVACSEVMSMLDEVGLMKDLSFYLLLIACKLIFCSLGKCSYGLTHVLETTRTYRALGVFWAKAHCTGVPLGRI